MDVLFETSRLAFRRWRKGDEPAVLRIFSDSEVVRFIGGKTIGDGEGARSFVARHVEKCARHGMGFWAVLEKVSGEIVGNGGIRPFDIGDAIELGYHLARPFWGRGYATELAVGSLRHGFETLKIPKIIAVADMEHAASRRVLAKAGMKETGRGAYHAWDAMFYHAFRHEWRAPEQA